MPKVSVIIPAYNAEPFLARALTSVQEQTRQGDEVIVIDDGSTDKTAEVARSFEGVTLIQQENQGQASARNAGLKVASGDLIAFLDADDEWLPEKLQRQVGFMEREASDFSFTDSFYLREGSRFRYSEIVPARGGEVLALLLRACFVTTNTVMARRSLLLDSGGFSEEKVFHGHEDYELWLRLAYQGVRFDYLDQPLAIYHAREESSSSDELYMQRSLVRTLKKITGEWKLDANARREAELQISGVAGSVAKTLIKRGRLREANYYLSQVSHPSWRVRFFYAISRILGSRPVH